MIVGSSRRGPAARLLASSACPPTALGSAAEVLLATGHDPFARGVLRRPDVQGWVAGGATAWLGVDHEERRSYLSALGDPVAVAALLAELLPELPPRQRVTLPRGTAALLPAWVGLGPGSADWDFRWWPSPPERQEAEDRVVPRSTPTPSGRSSRSRARTPPCSP
jgi:hypothetical protein